MDLVFLVEDDKKTGVWTFLRVWMTKKPTSVWQEEKQVELSDKGGGTEGGDPEIEGQGTGLSSKGLTGDLRSKPGPEMGMCY